MAGDFKHNHLIFEKPNLVLAIFVKEISLKFTRIGLQYKVTTNDRVERITILLSLTKL